MPDAARPIDAPPALRPPPTEVSPEPPDRPDAPALRPPPDDEPPQRPAPPEPPPPQSPQPPPPRPAPFHVARLEPNAGLVGGGDVVTIRGTGFRPGAVAYLDTVPFDPTARPLQLGFVSDTQLTLTMPPRFPGSATIFVTNPGGQFNGISYTYLDPASLVACARVVGVEPQTVIEDTDSVLVLRGRGLARAYEQGMVALRGPDRVRFTVADVAAARDPGGNPDADTVTLTLRVTAAPPLAPMERVAVQVWASCRPEAHQDLVVETSRQTFTVLPKDVPVPLAYTPLVTAGGATLVMVAGRNLGGASLALADDGEAAAAADGGAAAGGPRLRLDATWQDDGALVALVDAAPAPGEDAAPGGAGAGAGAGVDAAGAGAGPLPRLVVRDAAGQEVGAYALRYAARADAEPASAAAASAGAPAEALPNARPAADAGGAAALTPVPGQQLVGPGEGTGHLYDLRRGPLAAPAVAAVASDGAAGAGGAAAAPAAPGFGFGFEYEAADISIRVPLLDETRLVPFFDGGGDALGKLPVAARVGQLFQLRGLALLVSLRAELWVNIRVYVVVRWYPAFGYFNEFGDLYPRAFGTISVAVFVQIIVQAVLAFLVALVRGDGSLRVLASALLTVGVDLLLSPDRRRLTVRGGASGDVSYFARVRGLGPAAGAGCAGVARLASDGGQSRFTDAFGGVRAYFFGEAPGRCCVAWDYDLDLVRFREGRGEEVVQGRFRPTYCVDVAPSEALYDLYVDSAPPPAGAPPTLALELAQTAALRAMARRVDPATGQPVPGAAPLDLKRDLGYHVEFLLTNPTPAATPEVLDPAPLRDGAGVAARVGENAVGFTYTEARVLDDPAAGALALLPGAVVGFDLVRAFAEGRRPVARVRAQLPVRVTAPSLPVQVTLSTKDGGTRAVLARGEPFDELGPAPERPLRLVFENLPAGRPAFTVNVVVLEVALTPAPLSPTHPPPVRGQPPLAGRLPDARQTAVKVDRFFGGMLARAGAPAVSVPVDPSQPRDPDGKLRVVVPHTLTLHHVEGAQPDVNVRELVPPHGTTLTCTVLISDADPQQPTFAAPVRASVDLVVGAAPGSEAGGETYEEYYRVTRTARSLIAGSALKEFAQRFSAKVANSVDVRADVRAGGAELWTAASDAVRNRTPGTDDRSLYHVRLDSLAALRALLARAGRSSGEVLDLTRQFERASRGLDADTGAVRSAPGERTAIVTGFDPFALSAQPPEFYNPSGLAALALTGQPVTVDGVTTVLRAAVLPVRYADFDAGVVEAAISPRLGDAALLMTTSQGVAAYEIDRFASSRRSDAEALDNNNVGHDGRTGRGGAAHPAPALDAACSPTPGALPPYESRKLPTRCAAPRVPLPPEFAANPREYIETTLPHTVLRSAADTLPGPDPKGVNPFHLQQSYTTIEFDPKDPTSQLGKHRGDSTTGTPEAWQPVSDAPTHGPIEAGSGGRYLSNEIFYRAANVRRLKRPDLPSGHLHLPQIATNADQKHRDALVAGVQEALSRFLATVPGLASVAEVSFPDTVSGAAAPAAVARDAENRSSSAVVVGGVEVANVRAASGPAAPGVLPFAAVLASSASGPPSPVALPYTLPAGQKLFVLCTFAPPAAEQYEAEIIVRGMTGAPLLQFRATGRGVVPPAPVVAGFTPTGGRPGTQIVVSGANLAGATLVQIGRAAASVVANSPTSITATVPHGGTSGPIRVTTPGGTAASAVDFSVHEAPAIAALTPAGGVVGTPVTISGSGFSGASEVRFGGVAAPFTLVSPTSISATVPPGAVSGPVAVAAAGGTAASPAPFTVVVPPPVIAGFSPTSGRPGTEVTISGEHLAGVTAVRFGSAAAAFTVVSATTLTATVPGQDGVAEADGGGSGGGAPPPEWLPDTPPSDAAPDRPPGGPRPPVVIRTPVPVQADAPAGTAAGPAPFTVVRVIRDGGPELA